MKFAATSSCLALLLVSTGCTPREAPAPVAPAWSWESLPREDRLLVAQLPAHAGPARSETLRAPANGPLRLAPGINLDQVLPAGTVWGRIEAEDTAVEETALRRLENEIAQRAQRYAEMEKPGVLAQLDRDLRAAEDAAAAAAFAEKEPSLFSGDRPALDPALKPVLPARQLSEAATSLRARRDRIAAGDPALDPADLQALRAERERRQSTRDTRARQLQLTLPFDGRVLLADRRDGRTVTSGETLALAVDPAMLRIRLRATSPLLLAAPASSLEAEILLPGGTTVRAPFTSGGFDPAAPGATLLWFETPATAAVFETLGATGADIPARIFTRLPAPALIVPKLLVAREDLKDALAGGWRDAVPAIFPGARFVAEGRTAVAVEPPARR